ncbi:hypothetical protein AAKU55_005409 [Oxalobacteraceae bacterium GrIS 1.11]
MKPRLLLPSIIAIAFGAACLAPASAALPARLVGDPAPLSAATRTVVINSDTKWVNITGGEVVKFVIGDTSFAWSFDAPNANGVFDLSQIAPNGILNHPVRAYLAADPLYKGD